MLKFWVEVREERFCIRSSKSLSIFVFFAWAFEQAQRILVVLPGFGNPAHDEWLTMSLRAKSLY
jgi:hypothetical protein